MRLHRRQQTLRIRVSNFSAISAHSNPRQTSLLNKETTTKTTMAFQFSAPTPMLPPSSRSGLLYLSSDSRIDPPLGSCTRLPALPVPSCFYRLHGSCKSSRPRQPHQMCRLSGRVRPSDPSRSATWDVSAWLPPLSLSLLPSSRAAWALTAVSTLRRRSGQGEYTGSLARM